MGSCRPLRLAGRTLRATILVVAAGCALCPASCGFEERQFGWAPAASFDGGLLPDATDVAASELDLTTREASEAETGPSP
ncbi:MAG: hypothetical protein H6744_09360 [Deltaproteobacteria bacterium]|nr:hypothetical protein [Deltaproteobacteria bacterium]